MIGFANDRTNVTPSPVPASHEPTPPRLTGRRVHLRPIVEADYGFLFALETDEEMGYRWRHRGETPSPEVFVRDLWMNALVQFVVCGNHDDEPIGHVFAYNANLRNGTAFCAMALAPGIKRKGWALEAGALFIDYVFKLWDLRKLYGETLSFNYEQFAGGAGRVFKEEGRLGDHEYFDGQYWDLIMLALYRDEWFEHRRRRRAERPGSAFAAEVDRG
jgi:RimJ/RimL family protein N-acetyltransferase